MDKRFERHRRAWDRLGHDDPLWVVLTEPGKRGGGWNLGDFFRTGREEVDEVLREVEKEFPDLRRGFAIDFGCGVGRLTRALAAHFDRALGVDVSASMIEEARRLNADTPGCAFLLNERADLAGVETGSADFIYSNIVLQHIPPPFAEGYVREFVRILAPAGLAVFQIPYRFEGRFPAIVYKLVPPVLHELYRRLKYGGPRIDMYAVPVERVRALVDRAGGRIVREEETDAAGPAWRSKRYFVRRRGS